MSKHTTADAIRLAPSKPALQGRIPDLIITCPNCQHEIKVTESLAEPLITTMRKQFEAQQQAKEKEIQEREALIQKKEAELTKSKSELAEEIEKRLEQERARITKEELERAKRLVAMERKRGRTPGEGWFSACAGANRFDSSWMWFPRLTLMACHPPS